MGRELHVWSNKFDFDKTPDSPQSPLANGYKWLHFQRGSRSTALDSIGATFMHSHLYLSENT